jgi:phenylacetate-coenzyme A ligase PaaK-like adenylate-forming protein
VLFGIIQGGMHASLRLASLEGLAEKVTQRFRESIGLRPKVELVPPGTLPRFELKARRFFKS